MRAGAPPGLLDPAAASPRPDAPRVQAHGAEFGPLAAALEDELDSLVAAVGERARARGRGGPWAGVGLERGSLLARETLRAELGCFRRAALPERCPEADAGAAVLVAQGGRVETLLNGYRLCQVVLWEAWFALVEEAPGLALGRRRELLTAGSEFFFAYAELLGDQAAATFRAAAGLRDGDGERRRLELVLALLGGEVGAAAALDFDLGRHHLALVACGEGADAAARGLAAELRRPLLRVRGPRPDSCWAWISGTRPLDRFEEQVLAAYRPGGARLALGMEAFGEPGFRAGHRQAERTSELAAGAGPGVVRYEDVVLEALAAESEEDARAFIAHELRGIEDDSAGSRRLRETLAAYFAAEYNAASAAAALGIHPQTVANRLRAAEERLGRRSIASRRVELEIALRLRASFGAGPPPPAR